MSKRVILILLEILILSCDLLTNKEKNPEKQASEQQVPEKQTSEKQPPEQQEPEKKEIHKEQKPAIKIIPVVSIQTIEIRASNQVSTSTEEYYKQAYPIQTFDLDFSIKREKEFQQTEDKILPASGKVESLSILINKKLLDFKNQKNTKTSTLKNLKEIENIDNFFKDQDLLFVLTLKNKNDDSIISVMLNPPNDTQTPKDYLLKDLKETIQKGISEKYLNPIYRFQIKNNKDYHSIDYNKLSINDKTIELDLVPHNQVFQMNKNFTKILDTLTDINNLKLLIQKEYI
ncbi:hypothetical protein RAC47_04700 (plasmid) [Borreliella carolinensis]|uniref:Surface lipoprotein P27 n=1 Tax=Borreliella carolinensis TaxID=478174 RepID=A0ABY9E2X0_9SPIR|nr:hypothetical protein [Borreliella carolinensis]WKC90402.1 hypothetical protein QIA18_00240 [Borreliella carolinensis]WNY63381.1 hypothetical protein RAC47_04700 [Borreliella carolinensis]WNY65483.1 hypothetical protein QIA46_04770 [Borreliella carolinensis]WNY68229.1 hypothetical protein QIA42_04610 [Borreliella carolinensis]